MGHLSGPEVTGLALWSYGIVLARSGGLTRVAATLASQLEDTEGNLRQRLREWYKDKQDKQGRQRADWSVSQSFGPLLKWILAQWSEGGHQLVLAMDATSLKKLFVVLSISVVYRGCAIPVAWAVLLEGQKGSWKEPWLSLLPGLRQAVPASWRVVVMADRGLYARWLYDAIQQCGWHPFLRINLRSTYRARGTAHFQPMSQLLPSPGCVWAGQVTCFAHNSVEGTLLACWTKPYQQPWLILTDLPCESACAAWYGMRHWIEDGFKDFKRDGWQWQKTHMSDPSRVARIWLALAVATLWVVSVGGDASANASASRWALLPLTHVARRTKKRSVPCSPLSCFTRGLILILAALIAQRPIALGTLAPQPWPSETYP